MELKKNYKQTELGVIPEDWNIIALEKLTTRIGDGIHSTPQYNDNGEYYFVNGNNLVNGEIKITRETKRVANDEFLKHKRELGNHTILMSINGTIGNIAFYSGENILIGKSAAYININEKLEKKFFYQLLQVELIKKYFENELTGSTIKNLGLSIIRNTPIPLPPTKAEQTAIATALSDMDDLINSLSTLIEKKKAIKQGAMQQLLKPKEGWVVKKLGEVIKDFQNGYGFSAAGYVSDGTPIVTMAQIGLDGTFNFDETKVNKWVTTDFDTLKNFHLKDGDLIIAMTDVTPEKNLVGRMAIVKTEKVLLLNQRVGLLRLDISKVNPYFLKTLSNMRDWRLYCIGSASLGVQANLGTKDIMNGEITLPLIEEQDRIANILSDMDYEIQTLELNLSKHQMLKHGMMQELLTGKTRLI